MRLLKFLFVFSVATLSLMVATGTSHAQENALPSINPARDPAPVSYEPSSAPQQRSTTQDQAVNEAFEQIHPLKEVLEQKNKPPTGVNTWRSAQNRPNHNQDLGDLTRKVLQNFDQQKHNIERAAEQIIEQSTKSATERALEEQFEDFEEEDVAEEEITEPVPAESGVIDTSIVPKRTIGGAPKVEEPKDPLDLDKPKRLWQVP